MEDNGNKLSGEVEIDELYVTAGCKGNNNSHLKDNPPRKRGLKKRGRGTYDTDKTPILGLVERNGNIHFKVLKNVKTKTIKPIIQKVVAKNTTVYTDDYDIYNFLDKSKKYDRIVVRHSQGEYAIDLDNDGICESHVNTQEGIWSVLRPWIYVHRGVNKMYLPLYVAPCEFFYNNRNLTPSEQFLFIIKSSVSIIGSVIKELYIKKLLLTMFSV